MTLQCFAPWAPGQANQRRTLSTENDPVHENLLDDLSVISTLIVVLEHCLNLRDAFRSSKLKTEFCDQAAGCRRIQRHSVKRVEIDEVISVNFE